MPRSIRVRSAPPGLSLVENVIGAAEEAALLGEIARLPLAPARWRGRTALRFAVHFGWDYDAGKIAPAAPLPAFLEPLRERAARAAGLEPAAFAQILVMRYPAGAGIGWHRDAPMFGPTVAGVSLGADCTLRFRHEVDGGWERFDLAVPRRSLYLIGGEARKQWQHSIERCESERVSITFRTVRGAWREATRSPSP